MKFLLLLTFLTSISCSSQRKQNNEYIAANVLKIDSTLSYYILSLGNDRTKIIVPVYKDCTNKKLFKKKIQVGKNYKFELRKDRDYSITPTEIKYEIRDGIEVWNASMKDVIFYDDCVNMCGLRIKN